MAIKMKGLKSITKLFKISSLRQIKKADYFRSQASIFTKQNLMQKQTFRKIILFGSKGKLIVRWKILFGLRSIFLPSAFVTPLCLP